MAVDQLHRTLSLACRILEREGHEHSSLGHVSVRDPDDEAMHVKPSGIGLGEVGPGDPITLDLDGRVLAGNRSAHSEMPIHTEIYKYRDDVNAVVHTHAFHGTALAASTAPFAVVSQDSVHFHAGVAYYPSPQLVVTAEQGRRLADCLGHRDAAVLKNHGLVIVGRSLEEATFLAISFVNSVRTQLVATQFGGVDPIADEDVQAMAGYFADNYEGRVQTAWNFHARQLDDASPGSG